MTLNGVLAGLVAITAPCAFVSPLSAAIIGLAAGVVVVFSVLLLDRAKVDDPVGAVSVHGVCGALGTIALGLFAQEGYAPANTTGNGLLFGGGFHLLMAQAIGVASVLAWCVVNGLILFGLLKVTVGIRVSPEEEVEGLDVGEHGISAYPDFVLATPGQFSLGGAGLTGPAAGSRVPAPGLKNPSPETHT
jgi:Amt family ammonium transporter